MSTTVVAAPVGQSRRVKIVSWLRQIFAAAASFAAGGAKLAGVPIIVETFDHIGIGQWFRIVTGLVGVVGGLALLVPATAALRSITAQRRAAVVAEGRASDTGITAAPVPMPATHPGEDE